MRISNEPIVEDGDLSADVTSDPVWLGHIVYCSITCTTSDSPNGFLTLQVSNDDFHPRESASVTNLPIPLAADTSGV